MLPSKFVLQSRPFPPLGYAYAADPYPSHTAIATPCVHTTHLFEPDHVGVGSQRAVVDQLPPHSLAQLLALQELEREKLAGCFVLHFVDNTVRALP